MTVVDRALDLFDRLAVDPVTAEVAERIETLLKSAPTILDVGPAAARAARIAGRSFLGPIVHLPHAETIEFPGPGGPLPLRVIRAEDPRGVYLHIHGGGWCLGDHDQQDEYLDEFARATGLTVVSVGYRLAPEHPYPAAHDDCETAALWLLAHAESQFGAKVRVIGGESAGAHLAAATLLRLRDLYPDPTFEAALLSYGAYDLRMTPSVRRWGPRYLILSTPIVAAYIDWFEPSGLDRADPDLSPLLADLHGLPPALFTVGTLDPLLDDSLFMAARWRAAGNDSQLAVYPGGTHAFNALPVELPIKAAANDRLANFVLAALGART